MAQRQILHGGPISPRSQPRTSLAGEFETMRWSVTSYGNVK